MAFNRILIANRGEIAVRVVRSARALGYRTVAVYSDADRDAPHVTAADEALYIGAAPVGDSYLNSAAILAAARHSGAEAIHPGYGFFSENAEFARACIAAGLVFIGPDPESIEIMGNKSRARARVIAAGVPCASGYEGDNQDAEFLRTEADRIGYPVMIKAAVGGGGRGMRLVAAAAEFGDALLQATAEAQSAFGDGAVLLEKALIDVRHVEVQVFGDRQGTILHLGERDCSVQRRHQKVLEEAPSPAVDAELRERMGAAAVAAAQAVNYVGAGTVEFLLDANGNFYFMEMNTRLQVEHPVTELVTGLDLVEWQLRVAAGEALPLTQEQIELNGHAIEVRLYAEDPSADYLPQTGRIVAWHPAQNTGVRVDSGIVEGQEVTPYYDPMLAKVIAHGVNRDQALRRLRTALEDTHLLGVVTNREFLLNILRDSCFAGGGATTAFLPERPQLCATPQSDGAATALAAVLLSQRGNIVDVSGVAGVGNYGWRSTGTLSWPMRVQVGEDEPATVWLEQDALRYTLTQLNGDVYQLALTAAPMGVTGAIQFLEQGRLRRAWYAFLDDGQLALDISGTTCYYRSVSFSERREAVATNGLLSAPMSGKIVAVSVAPGDRVSKGQVLVTLEAMKMFHQLVADSDGTVATVHVVADQQVDIASALIALEPQAAQIA